MNSFETLIYLKDLLLLCLDELKGIDNQFCCGERTAYVECLEALSLWEYSQSIGLDFDIEERYPLK